MDDKDDISKIESKVVLALRRLQRGNRKDASGRTNGVNKNRIVKYLKTNFSYLDGDIESQVLTALLSCVKTGVVCAMGNGKYRLMAPYSKAMISECFGRGFHGAKCCCLEKLMELSRSQPKSGYSVTIDVGVPPKTEKCGVAKKSSPRPRRTRRKRKKLCYDQKEVGKVDSKTTKKLKEKKETKTKKASKIKKDVKCKGSKAQNEEKKKGKCEYCFSFHDPPNKSKSLCKTCYPLGKRQRLTCNTLSLREDVV